MLGGWAHEGGGGQGATAEEAAEALDVVAAVGRVGHDHVVGRHGRGPRRHHAVKVLVLVVHGGEALGGQVALHRACLGGRGGRARVGRRQKYVCVLF